MIAKPHTVVGHIQHLESIVGEGGLKFPLPVPNQSSVVCSMEGAAVNAVSFTENAEKNIFGM